MKSSSSGTAAGIALWLFVINLGIVFGAGLYEARIEFPQWLTVSPDGVTRWNAAAANAADSGLRFWAFASTGSLTLLTLWNLFLAFRTNSGIRKWWLTAASVALAERIFTFVYFIPTMITLMQDASLSESEAVAKATLWGTLNHMRHILVLFAWLAALKAFKHFRPATADSNRPRTVSA